VLDLYQEFVFIILRLENWLKNRNKMSLKNVKIKNHNFPFLALNIDMHLPVLVNVFIQFAIPLLFL